VEEITGQKVVVEDELSVEKTATVKLKNKIDSLLETIEALKQRGAALEDRIRQLEGALDASEAEKEALRAEVQRIKDEAARRYHELTREIEQITGVKIKVEGDLNEEQTVTGSLREEIARLLRTIEDLKNRVQQTEDLKQRIAELEDECHRLQDEVKVLEIKAGHFSDDFHPVVKHAGATHHKHDEGDRHARSPRTPSYLRSHQEFATPGGRSPSEGSKPFF